jgi:hypothetical protein
MGVTLVQKLKQSSRITDTKSLSSLMHPIVIVLESSRCAPNFQIQLKPVNVHLCTYIIKLPSPLPHIYRRGSRTQLDVYTPSTSHNDGLRWHCLDSRCCVVPAVELGTGTDPHDVFANIHP